MPALTTTSSSPSTCPNCWPGCARFAAARRVDWKRGSASARWTWTFTDPELRWNGERVPMSPRELALTEVLMQNSGRVVTKESIVAQLSSWESDFSENSVEVYVNRLRKRFADLGVVIKTVRGFGYVMEAAAGSASAAP